MNEEAQRELRRLIEEGRRIDGESPSLAEKGGRTDREPPLLARVAAVSTLLWTLFGPAGLAQAASTMQSLDKGWFGLGLFLFQGPCAVVNLLLLGTAVVARWRSVLVACLVTTAMEAALVWLLSTASNGSGC